ncbi:MAG: hypothetical protein JXA69_05390 [Phycisphaerae bacterium]|nr:hypothetical protein [Phycisphaerae bacterium]
MTARIGMWLAIGWLAAPSIAFGSSRPILTPPVKEIRWSDDKPAIIRPGSATLVLGNAATDPERHAAERLQAHVKKRYDQQWPIVAETEDTSAYSAVILLGQRHTHRRLDQLCQEHRINLTNASPGHDGYVVEMLGNGDQLTVFIAGSNARGVVYGQDTLFQLLSRRNDALVLTRASIRDWPSIPWRGRPHAHYRNYSRPGEMNRYATARINFIDLRNDTYAFSPDDALPEDDLASLVRDAHRRGLFVFGTVHCGVPASEHDAVLHLFERMIALGVDGLWMSFDDKGPGDQPESLVARILELGRKHGITGEQCAICPPKGSYQELDTPFNRRIAAIPGAEKSLWFFTARPSPENAVAARSIGLQRKCAWWHNWTRPGSGFTHLGSASQYVDGRRSYMEVPPLAEGWHAPSYDLVRRARNYLDAVMPWGGSGWGQYYIAPVIGWWGWSPEDHDFDAARRRIYDIVYGPGQVAAMMEFDDTLRRVKSLFTYASDDTPWQPPCPARFKHIESRERAIALLDKLAHLQQRIAEQSPANTMLPLDELNTAYLEPMRGEAETGKAAASLRYPEYWWDEHQREVLAAVYAGDLARADQLIADVRKSLLHDLDEVREALSSLRYVKTYVQWWTSRANMSADDWEVMAAARRTELASRVWEYGYYVARQSTMLRGLNAPPLDWGTGRWEKKNRILATVLPSEQEQFWGDWIAGIHRKGNLETAVFAYARSTYSSAGQYAELPLTIPTKGRRDRLALLLYVSNADKETIGLHYVPSRWAGRRFLELLWEDRILWQADLGERREAGQWFMVRLPLIDAGAATLPLRLRVIDRKDLYDHTIVFVGPVQLMELAD